MNSLDRNIEFYNVNSASLYSQYQSISFDSVHSAWIKMINFDQCKTALDIGAGSGFEDGRTAFQLDANRTIEEAKQFGLSLILSEHEEDKLSRNNVSWQTLCFKA